MPKIIEEDAIQNINNKNMDKIKVPLFPPRSAEPIKEGSVYETSL